MKILHCSDFHANARWFDWLVDTAPSFDLVCFTGDLLNIFDTGSIKQQLKVVTAGIARVSVPMAICSGNHDSLAGHPSLHDAKWMENLRRRNLWLDGDQFQIAGQRFRCIGWNGPHPQRQNGEIWLHHAPPSESPVSFDEQDNDVGSNLLSDLCVSGLGPDLVLSGHQHHPFEWECRLGQTHCFNPGCEPRNRVPNHIVMDTVKRTAVLRVNGVDNGITRL